MEEGKKELKYLYLPGTETPVRPDEIYQNAASLLQSVTERFPYFRYLGTREFLPPENKKNTRGFYEWYTYLEGYKYVGCIAEGLTKIGINKGDRVLIMAPNMTEWIVSDIAVNTIGAVLVPLYDSQSEEDIIHVANHSEALAILMTAEKFQKHAKLLKDMKHMKHIILFDDSWDDRKTIKNIETKLKFEVPQFTLFRHHSNLEMDLSDKKHRRYNPLNMKLIKNTPYAERNKQITVPEFGNTPLFDYTPPDYVIPSTVITDENIPLVTATYNTIVNLGFSSLYKKAGPKASIIEPVSSPEFPDKTGEQQEGGSLIETSKKASGKRRQMTPYTILSVLPYVMLDTKSTKPEDLYILQFTSGTSGTPKGACLTTYNIMYAFNVYVRRIPDESTDPDHKKQGTNMSYLPCAHIFQHVLQYMMLYHITATAFFTSVANLMEDAVYAQPHIFPSVPRVLQKFFDGISAKLASLAPSKRFVFFSAYDSMRRMMKSKIETNEGVNTNTNKVYQFIARKIFADVRNALGGRVNVMASGSAPLNKKISEFIQIIFNFSVIEGYGLSETSAVGICQSRDDFTVNNIGHSVSNMHITLLSMEDFDYTIHDKTETDGKEVATPRGEILLCGDGIFKGYYKNEEATEKAFIELDVDQNGVRGRPTRWFRTGDVGMLLPDGRIQVIDRLNNIIKLSQGEFVSCAEIETVIGESKFLAQAIVTASRFESYIFGVANPNVGHIRKTLAAAHPEVADMTEAELCTNTDVLAAVLADVVGLCKKAGLKPYEIPRAVILDPELWTADNNMATPSMKLKSNRITQKWKTVVASAYEVINAKNPPYGDPSKVADIISDVVLANADTEETSSHFSANSVFTSHK